MKIEPVKVKISDLWKYSHVVYLMDRDDYLEDILLARKKLKIKDLVPRGEFELLKEVMEDFAKNNFEIKFIQDDNPEKTCKRKYFEYALDSGDLVEDIMKKYNKGSPFRNVIRYSIISHEVWEKDFTNDSFFYIENEAPDFLSGYLSFGTAAAAITLYPSTTKQEVLKIFSDYKKHVKFPDTISNIKRDRQWYWLKKNGKSYGEILAYAEKRGERITREGVIKAIQQYSARIAAKI